MTDAARGLCVLVLLLAGAVGAAQAQETGGLPAGDGVSTAPVELDGTVLFRVRGVSALPASERARVIHDRIVAVAANPAIPVDALRVVQTDGAIRILAGDQPILGVVEADASLEQVTPTELSAALLYRLREAISTYRAARSPAALRRAMISTALATILLCAVTAAVLWFWRWVDRFLTRRLHTRIHSVGIQSFEVVRADRIWAAVRNALIGLRTILLLAIFLTYLGYVLGQWPRTRGFARDMVGFALAPLETIGQGLVANIPSLVFLAVLFFFVRFALKLVRLFFEAVSRGTVVLSGFDAEWGQPTYKIVRVLIVAFALVVAYPYIPGSESDAFKGVSLFLGIVFSLGSSTAIALTLTDP